MMDLFGGLRFIVSTLIGQVLGVCGQGSQDEAQQQPLVALMETLKE
jgi:hypothetical protein